MMLLMCFEDRCLTAAGTRGQVCPVSSWGSRGRGDISFWRPLHLYYIEHLRSGIFWGLYEAGHVAMLVLEGAASPGCVIRQCGRASCCAGPRRRVASVSSALGWAGSIVRLWSYEWSSASASLCSASGPVWGRTTVRGGGSPSADTRPGWGWRPGHQCWGQAQPWTPVAVVPLPGQWPVGPVGRTVGGSEQQQCPDTCT